MAYELTGKVKLIREPQTFSSGFTKREIVVTVEDGKYPQDICLEFLQDKVGLLDPLNKGQEVTISFDIRGREYNGRHFNNLVGWRVVAGDPGAPPSGSDGPPSAEEDGPDPESSGDFDEPTPF